MKQLLLTSAVITGLAFQPALAERPEPPRTAIFVIVENGGTVTNRDEALETIQYTFGEIIQLRRKREFREAQVYLIFSASPTTVSWAGTPQQLYEQGPAVMELMQFHDSCSDIKLAWEQIGLTAQITMPEDIRLISIGPVINAAFPCDEGETVITLPQPIPPEIPIGTLAMESSQLRMLNVHPD